MSTPNRPAGSEPYIVAMANQADRSNRPTKFIVLALLVVLACTVYALFGIKQFVEGSARLDRLVRDEVTSDRLLNEIESLNNRNPDLQTLYPPAALMPNHLRAAARAAFADNPDTETTPDLFDVGDVQAKDTETTRGRLQTITVTVQIRGRRAIPIDDILLFIQTALDNDPTGLMFLSHLEIEPNPQGWTVTSIDFRRYSYNPRR